MIVQIDADPAEEYARDRFEPDRIQIGLRRVTPPNGYYRDGRFASTSCPRRWLLHTDGRTYHVDDPDESWD